MADIARLRDPVTSALPEGPVGSGRPARLPRLVPLRPLPAPWRFAAGASAACVTLALAIWASAQVHTDRAVLDTALFVHLASLVLGFGAVLVADYFLLLWLLGRAAFGETMNAAMRLHLPVWAGLTGLVVSGTMLQPDLSSGLTRLKLACVFALTLNGVQLPILSRRMTASAGAPGPRLLRWGATATAISQLCWWSAILIGFWTTSHRH